MSTVTVTNDYTVLAGQVMDFTDETGFAFAASNDASLFVNGQVSVHSANQNITGATSNGSAFYFNSVLAIAATGSFVVSATGPSNDATGFYSGSWAPGLKNQGTFAVSSAHGNATGMLSWSPDVKFANSGDFTVTAGHTALGVYLYNGGTYTNSGHISVTGATAIAVELPFYRTSLTNSGSIIAHDTTNATAIAVKVDASSWAVAITNSGLIEGEAAISATTQGSALNVTNTGTMTGSVILGTGGDTLDNRGTINGNVFLGNGNDTYSGASGTMNGTVHGGLANDTLTGGIGNDILFGDDAVQSGQDGNDVLHGGAGNDLLIGQYGNDTIDGGDGNDTAGYDTAVIHVAVDLSNLAAQDTIGAGIDTLSGIENLRGSAFADKLTGDGGNNALAGNDGDDVLDGGAGDDVLSGGAGNDTLKGGFGADTLEGGAGNDTYTVKDANDAIVEIAGGGKDLVQTSLAAFALGAEVENLSYLGHGDFTGTGNAAVNTIKGGAGNDTLTGGGGGDVLNGLGGADVFVYGNTADSVASGYDRIEGFDAASDAIDLWFGVDGFDGAGFTASKLGQIDTTLDAAHLGAHHAAVVTLTSGQMFLVVDANGVAGYQADADLVIRMDGAVNLDQLGTATFV